MPLVASFLRNFACVAMLWNGAWCSLVAAPAAISPAPSSPPPLLYCYPPPAVFGDYRVYSPVTLTSRQITTDFPEIKELAGPVIILCWSTIEPQSGQYDFSIIDDAVRYWGARGKKVVLSVSTIGNPIRGPDGRLRSNTPDWVLQKVSTFQQDAPVLPWTPDKTRSHALTTFPSYFDPRFVEETRRLVDVLGARYDGNPVISQVRIGTGDLGEDNATFDGLKADIPGWSKTAWIGYCRQVSEIYLRAFPTSQLEFDEGWIAIIQAIGTPAEQATARAYSEWLNAHHIFRAFNGLESQDIGIWRRGQAGGPLTLWERCLYTDLTELQKARQAGCSIGLEAVGPTDRAGTQDGGAIADIVNTLHVNRVVLFDEVPMLLRFSRTGQLPSTAVGLCEVPPSLIASNAAFDQELLTRIGCSEH